MTASKLEDYSRLCVHTVTTRPWEVEEAASHYASAGIPNITIWRPALKGRNPVVIGRFVRDLGLQIVSYVRGGFFPAESALERQAAIDDNKVIIDEAAALGAPMVVLVCGATPEQSLEVSRAQIYAGIDAILPHAEAAGVKLGIEPLHPVYADYRSAINTMAQANDAAEAFDSPMVGVVVDVYHLWWDPLLEAEIARCGRNGNLFAYHVSDWKTPTEDVLMDRGLMGEGCIPLKQIRTWVEQTDYTGTIEVEIFSERYWKEDQAVFLESIKKAYLEHV